MRKILLILAIISLGISAKAQYIIDKEVNYKGKMNTGLFYKPSSKIVMDFDKNKFYVNYEIYFNADSTNKGFIGLENIAIALPDNIETALIILIKQELIDRYKLTDKQLKPKQIDPKIIK